MSKITPDRPEIQMNSQQSNCKELHAWSFLARDSI